MVGLLESLLLSACDEVVRFAAGELGLKLHGLAESPVCGREMGLTAIGSIL